MDNLEALNILDNSWSKQRLLDKIKKGENSDKIVNDFFKENEKRIDLVVNLINEKDKNFLNQLEILANCEIKLINKLKTNGIKSDINSRSNINNELPIQKIYKEFSLPLFMNKWSNQFVIGILIMISLLSLTKQAWA